MVSHGKAGHKRDGAVQRDVARYIMAWQCVALNGVAWHGTAQCVTARCIMAQCGMVQRGTWHGTVAQSLCHHSPRVPRASSCSW